MHKQSTQFDHSQYVSKNTTNRKDHLNKEVSFQLIFIAISMCRNMFSNGWKISWIVLENKQDKMKAFFFYI